MTVDEEGQRRKAEKGREEGEQHAKRFLKAPAFSTDARQEPAAATRP